MAKLPSGPRPILIHFGGQPTRLAPKRGGTAPPVPRPAPPATSPPADAGPGPFSELAAALKEQTAASARGAESLDKILNAMELGFAQIVRAGDDLNAIQMKAAEAFVTINETLERPRPLSEEHYGELKTAIDHFGRMASALEAGAASGGEPSLCGAAILAIAAGSQGGFSKTAEGNWFGYAGFKYLNQVPKVGQAEFIVRMRGAREEHEDLRSSGLVANATTPDLLFIYRAALVAVEAIPPKELKKSNP